MSAAGATAPGRPRTLGRALRIARLPGPTARRRLAALAALGALLLAGYHFWLRDSSLVEVRTVSVTGLSGADAGRIRSALGTTARDMTTLHVDRSKLERAASAFPVIRAIEVRPDFPHAIRVHVREHSPAAVLVARSGRVPVAGDGTVLAGLAVKRGLPEINVSGAMPARHVPRGAELAAVRVAAGLPSVLRERVKEIGREPGKGVVVPLDGGPKLIFGDGSRSSAKWAAAVRVLADPDAAGAAYVDVRIPERPAAGGLPVQTVDPLAPAGAPAPVAPGTARTTPEAPQASGAPTAPAAPAPAPAPAGVGNAPVVPQPGQAAPPAAGGGAPAPNPQP